MTLTLPLFLFLSPSKYKITKKKMHALRCRFCLKSMVQAFALDCDTASLRNVRKEQTKRQTASKKREAEENKDSGGKED